MRKRNREKCGDVRRKFRKVFFTGIQRWKTLFWGEFCEETDAYFFDTQFTKYRVERMVVEESFHSGGFGEAGTGGKTVVHKIHNDKSTACAKEKF